MQPARFRQSTVTNHPFIRSAVSVMDAASIWSQALRPHRKVPLVRQTNAVGCGAACLAMMLSYYGRKTSFAEAEAAVQVGRDGVTAKAIAQAARSFGLQVKAYSLEAAYLKTIALPAIAFWNQNHFVVIERVSAQKATIVDPAIGRYEITAQELALRFTGIVLTFEPSQEFERRQVTAPPLWWNYAQHLWHTPGIPRLLGQVLITSLLLQMMGLALPIFTQVLVDQVLPLRLTNIMTLLGLGILLVTLSQIITSYLRATVLIQLQGRLDSQLMLGTFAHVLSLPLLFFQKRTSGDLLARLSSNVLIREMLTLQTLSIALDVPLMLLYLLILFGRDAGLGAIVLAIGLLQVGLLWSTHHRVHALTQRNLVMQAESHNYLIEALTGIATLKATGAEDRALAYWSGLFFKQLQVSLQSSHLSALIDTVLNAVRTLTPLLLLWIGAMRVFDGTMSLGTMLALNTLATLCLAPLASLVANGQKLQLVGAHLERLSDVLEAEPEQNLRQVQPAPPIQGQIDLRHVHFRYDAHSPWVLKDISVTIQPGQKVALVGRTGSGKSTLAKLLLGLYVPNAGEILYEGMSLQQLNYRTLRSQFGAVLQESALFSGSIRQNIAFNNPDVSLEAVVEAARSAAIHDDITQMPMGYETLISANGVGLSGGQRQRLLMARALVNQPAVLLLDEATSQLDTVTERLADENLNQLACTRIVIAHRLSTVQNADRILVLDQGEIVEQGTHAELLAKNGYYAALLHSQLAPHSTPASSSLNS